MLYYSCSPALDGLTEPDGWVLCRVEVNKEDALE